MEIKLTDLQFLHSLFEPFLNNGITCAIFELFGINPELRDNVYNLAKGFAIIVHYSNNNLGCKSSGPGLLFIFNSFNFLSTICSDILIEDKHSFSSKNKVKFGKQ